MAAVTICLACSNCSTPDYHYYLLLCRRAWNNVVSLTWPSSLYLLGYTLLHCAAAWGRLETLKALVELDVDIEALNFRKERARDVAVRYSQTECVEFLDWAGKEAYKVVVANWLTAGVLSCKYRVTGCVINKAKRWLTFSPSIRIFVCRHNHSHCWW